MVLNRLKYDENLWLGKALSDVDYLPDIKQLYICSWPKNNIAAVIYEMIQYELAEGEATRQLTRLFHWTAPRDKYRSNSRPLPINLIFCLVREICCRLNYYRPIKYIYHRRVWRVIDNCSLFCTANLLDVDILYKLY